MHDWKRNQQEPHRKMNADDEFSIIHHQTPSSHQARQGAFVAAKISYSATRIVAAEEPSIVTQPQLNKQLPGPTHFSTSSTTNGRYDASCSSSSNNNEILPETRSADSGTAMRSCDRKHAYMKNRRKTKQAGQRAKKRTAASLVGSYAKENKAASGCMMDWSKRKAVVVSVRIGVVRLLS